ncbi:hypothetical protein EXIGLDRAFT_317179 [Exidia glandulosa HHB12029]|uniref:Uncharacterized protein n=1 Tax=Exidia glandulosa HHB12029 TaxID=1314781 RepID=A0A165CWR7_EXIGL|nr:hypothetical protein EXIGLDRAFT_317179 [Exidia glandulosa HHB12029]
MGGDLGAILLQSPPCPSLSSPPHRRRLACCCRRPPCSGARSRLEMPSLYGYWAGWPGALHVRLRVLAQRLTHPRAHHRVAAARRDPHVCRGPPVRARTRAAPVAWVAALVALRMTARGPLQHARTPGALPRRAVLRALFAQPRYVTRSSIAFLSHLRSQLAAATPRAVLRFTTRH